MNIALIGYGSMGRAAEAAATARGHSIAAVFTSANPLPPEGSDLYRTSAIHCCIDFSVPDAVHRNAEVCSALGIPLVLGTTGWHRQKQEIIELVRGNGGTLVYGNNFSVGAQMFFRIVRRAARLMNSFAEYDVGIHETHHIKKKDIPSGTAVTLSQILLSQMQRKRSVHDPHDPLPLKPEEISVASSRIGAVIGEHSVLFQSLSDEIELVHRAHNRNGFASGAVLAAELALEFPGIHAFEELIFEKTFTHQ